MLLNSLKLQAVQAKDIPLRYSRIPAKVLKMRTDAWLYV